jgi:peroxiredoxin
MSLTPRQPVPAISLPLVGGGRWSLPDAAPEAFTLALFYRGQHCPICRTQLQDFQAHLDGFAKKGARVVAISTDGAERAAESKRDWGLDRLDIAYGLSVEEARAWGLFISTHRGRTSLGVEEPALFNEPGLFLIRPDNTLYASYVQSAPFTRPKAEEVLKAIGFVQEKDYPARGEA